MNLSTQHLSKNFRLPDGQTLHVLRDLNLSVNKGETVAIMGPSGCGKSTLIAALAGLTDWDQGEVFYDGCPLTSLTEPELRRLRSEHIGIIFQSFHLLPHLNALDNVRFPLELRGINQAHEIALQALAEVGLTHRIHSFPSLMSRGECQRVAIARVLSAKPSVILADEPTGSLDQVSAQKVMQLLIDLSQSRSISLVIVTHDPEMAAHCQSKYRFRNGHLLAEL